MAKMVSTTKRYLSFLFFFENGKYLIYKLEYLEVNHSVRVAINGGQVNAGLCFKHNCLQQCILNQKKN